MRPYQVATAAVFVLIAAVAMFDTRAGALPDTTGGAPGGLRGGWYPFWSAAVIAASGVAVIARSLSATVREEGAFKDRGAVADLVRFILPMAATTYLMAAGLLGFYIASGLYFAYYAGVVARYRWHWAILTAVVIPVVIYYVFEVGFGALLPKSFLYPGLPF